MKVINTKSSWFKESDLRLDASYHLSDGPLTKLKLKASPFEVSTLSQETKEIFKGNIFKRAYVSKASHGFPFMTASDMLKTDIISGKFVSKKYTETSNLLFEKGWTLVSRSGTLGSTAYTNEDFEGVVGTDDLIRIVPNSINIKGGYLYAYLTSKYGYGLLTQSSYGGVIKHIEPHHIQNLPIPILPDARQQEIHSLIEDASKLRVEANALLKEIIEEIESNFDRGTPKQIYSVNIKKIKAGDKYTKEARLEADFYKPSTDYLEMQIVDAQAYSLLGDLCESVSISNLRARTFVSKGIVLFTGQSLGLNKPDMSKQLSRKFTKKIEENTTVDGDVLISAFGTLGKTEYCFQNFYSGIFASQQIARIRVNENKIDAGYIYIFLKSKIGQALIQKYKTGSVIEWANWNNFCSIKIPLPNDKGKQIGDKARIISKNFQKAYEKETMAVSIVEKEIESWQES